jgi:prolyl-tRNA synthetase
MRLSSTVIHPLRYAPKDADTTNHRLLVQAGFVRQLMAGAYTYLPLGLRVLNKISDIVREEMSALGAEEVLMPMLHPAEIWKKTGGWDNIDVLFKLDSRTGKQYALGQSQEEVVTPLMKEFLASYKNLPRAVYHIQWKFRDELRAKSGVLRGREFLMKDMYSLHMDQADFEKFYRQAKEVYIRIFERLGLTAKVTEASGGGFSEKISYEFEVLTDAGEANVLYCNECDFCVNVDDIGTYNSGDTCPRCKKGGLIAATAAEVGNVFDLGKKYSESFDIKIAGADGEMVRPIMGCYGIGISRTMGVIVEKFHDDKGIVWPESIAPYQVHIVDLNQREESENLYNKLTEAGVEVLWDNRDLSAGQKFADADLIGCPIRLVISEKTRASGVYEYKRRSEVESATIEMNKVMDLIRS